MRLIFSAIPGFALVAAFVVFFVLSSVLAYVESPDPLLDSSRRHDWRGAIVTLTADHVAKEVAADPSLEEMSIVELRVILSNAITSEWLEESLRTGHAALRRALAGAQSDAVFNLRGTKSALRDTLTSLKSRSENNCESLLGAKNCADAKEAKRMMNDFEREALRAIAGVADEVDLLESLQGNDRQNAKRLKEGLGQLENFRLAALGALLVNLFLILWINNSSGRRLVVVTSALAILSSAVYFIALGFSNNLAKEGSRAAIGDSQDPVREFSATIAQQMLDDAVFGSAAPVLLVGVLGAAGLVIIALRGRRRA